MEKHHGKIIERVVRRANMSLSELSKLMGVNRRSMYNWFVLPKVKPEIIFRLGKALEHDFSQEFPEFFERDDFKDSRRYSGDPSYEIVPDKSTDDGFWKDKYISLLEKMNSMMVAKKNVSV
ncbi:helix-turn-helix domain-containing protein [Arcticibacter sp.]|uniref:helix-turn-helix domain-containing protein n=1 Tax=Arcticibacter sp. TaxID=1872630 RepID=UPI00389082B8